MFYAILVLAALGTGWIAGMWTRRIVDRTCPWTVCSRTLRCPIHEPRQIAGE